jgi:hypothetical protein
VINRRGVAGASSSSTVPSIADGPERSPCNRSLCAGACEMPGVHLDLSGRRDGSGFVGSCVGGYMGSNDPRMRLTHASSALDERSLYAAADDNSSGVGFVYASNQPYP